MRKPDLIKRRTYSSTPGRRGKSFDTKSSLNAFSCQENNQLISTLPFTYKYLGIIPVVLMKSDNQRKETQRCRNNLNKFEL